MVKPKDKPVIVVGDFGNSHFKVIVVFDDGTTREWIIPHDLLYLTPAQFEKAQSRAKYQSSRVNNSVTFKKIYRDGDEQFYIIGQEAVENRNSNKRIGSNKYIRGYFDAVLTSCLLQIFPDGHDNIILGVGYPPSEIASVPQMLGVLEGDSGIHKAYNLNGDEIKYAIRHIVSVDEPIGSLEWYKYNNAKFNPININPGDRFLLIDIGGSIGSIGRVIVNQDGTFAPLYNDFQPINAGVNDVYRLVQQHLKSLYPEYFPTRDIPLHIIKEAIAKRELSLSGENPFDVSEAVNQSLGIVDDVEALYDNQFDGGRYDKGVLMTGGSMVDLFPEFEAVINHKHASPVTNVNEIIMANARGMMLIVVAALIKEGKLPENYKGVFDAYTF